MGMPDKPSRRVPAWLLLALPLLTSIGCDQAVAPDLEQDAFQRLLSNQPEASPSKRKSSSRFGGRPAFKQSETPSTLLP